MKNNRHQPRSYLEMIADIDLPTGTSKIPPANKKHSSYNAGYTFDRAKLVKCALLCAWLILILSMLFFSYRESISDNASKPLTKEQRFDLSEKWYHSQRMSLDLGVDADPNYRITVSSQLKNLMAKGVYLDCLRVLDVSHYQLNIYRVAGAATYTLPTANQMFSVGVLSYYSIEDGQPQYRYTKLVEPDGSLDGLSATRNHSVIEKTKISEYRVEGECTPIPSLSRSQTNDDAFFSHDKPSGFLLYRHLVDLFSKTRG